MSTTNKKQLSYVFSKGTLDLTFEQWLHSNIEKQSDKQQQYLIVQAALPWFMQHLNHNKTSIYMFSHSDLLAALKSWKADQVAAYPQQKKRIEKTVQLIMDFFDSDLLIQNKMVVTPTAK